MGSKLLQKTLVPSLHYRIAYCTHTTRGLNISNTLFEGQKRFFKEVPIAKMGVAHTEGLNILLFIKGTTESLARESMPPL
jgi:hypothetical protein